MKKWIFVGIASALWALCSSAAARYTEVSGPVEDLRDAAAVVERMAADPEGRELLDESKGLFIVPFYATGALLVGGTGGEGVLLARDGEDWSDPVFYNIGSAKLGARADAALGSIALAVRSEEALSRFMEGRSFAFGQQSELSLINWAFLPIDGLIKSDIVAWSDTEGLLGEAALEFSEISWDREETDRYYGERFAPWQILSGQASNPHEHPLNSPYRPR